METFGLPLLKTQGFPSSNMPNCEGWASTYDATTGAAISTGFITGLSYPDGLALSGNTLFVSNQNPGTIGVYDATTGAAINGRFITGLDRPGRLVVSDNNTLFAISGNTVGAYNATSGVSINGSFSRGLSDAVGLAVSGTTLFVSDFGIGVQGAGTVSTYNTTTGAVINAPLITGLSGPEGLAISGNTLFVASFGSFPPVAGAATVGAYNATTGAAIAAKFITGLTAATELAVAGPPVSQLPGSLLPQTIAFGALSNVTLGIAPFTLSATASSGLAVTFASATPSDCTVSGNTVTIIGAGTCSITASQSGNSSYAAAAPVTRSFTVNSASGASLSVTSGLLNFQIPQGAAAQSQALQIGGTAGTAWQATATSTGGAWLSVLPGAGQIPASLMAVVNPGGLAVGTYQGRITIQAPGATPPSIAIGVTLTVTAASGQGGGATIENLKFTGTATCIDSFCAHFGSGPITGTYSLNVTAQTIDGPWMFSGPFGTISSTDPGAKATVYVGSANVQSVFDVSTSTFEEFVKINFPPSDVQQLGAVIEAPGTNACINVPGGVNGSAACDPDYLLTGATTLVSVSGPPSITPGGIVPFYSTVSTIQPGELVSIYGTNLAASTASLERGFPELPRRNQCDDQRQAGIPCVYQPDADQLAGAGRFRDRSRPRGCHYRERHRHFNCDAGPVWAFVPSVR